MRRRLTTTTGRLAPAALGLALLLTGGTSAGVALTGLPDADGPGSDRRAAATAVRAPVADLTTAVLPVPVDVVTPPIPAPTASPRATERATPPAAPVRPLGTVHVPDLLLEVPGGLSGAQLAAVDAVTGVTALTALDVGDVTVAGRPHRVVGVDPSAFRAFTPRETAASDPLWQAVARGELAGSYGLQRDRSLRLGADVEVTGAQEVTERLGAVAAFAVPEVDLVVRRDVAVRLGAQRSSALLVSAPGRSISRLRRAVLAATGPAQVTVLRPATPAPSTRSGKPRTYRELYVDGATYCPGLSWTVLASIGQIESGHGRNLGPSSAGALGPMQFMPATWASYGVDGDGDGDADTMDPFDAIPAAALYLCRHGANRGEQGLYDAIFAYNHADWYVRKVLALAEQYRLQG